MEKHYDFTQVEKTFKAMGYDRVYPPGASVDEAIVDFKADLGL